MPYDEFLEAWQGLQVIRAQDHKALIQVASFPHIQKSEDKKKYWRHLTRVETTYGEWQGEGKTKAQLAAEFARKLDNGDG